MASGKDMHLSLPRPGTSIPWKVLEFSRWAPVQIVSAQTDLPLCCSLRSDYGRAGENYGITPGKLKYCSLCGTEIPLNGAGGEYISPRVSLLFIATGGIVGPYDKPRRIDLPQTCRRTVWQYRPARPADKNR